MGLILVIVVAVVIVGVICQLSDALSIPRIRPSSTRTTL